MKTRLKCTSISVKNAFTLDFNTFIFANCGLLIWSVLINIYNLKLWQVIFWYLFILCEGAGPTVTISLYSVRQIS